MGEKMAMSEAKLRTVKSVGVIAVFALSLVATSKPPKQDEAGAEVDAGPSADAVFDAVRAADAAPIPSTACSDALLEAARRDVRVGTSWEHPDIHKVHLVDSAMAARFSRANAQANNPDDGFRWLSSSAFRDSNPETYQVVENSDSKVKERTRHLTLFPFFAVLRADARKLPAKTPGSDEFTGGSLTGKIVVARVDTGAPICSIAVSAASSSTVSFKSRGLTGKSFEKAIQDDFESQATGALRRVFKATAPSFTLDVE
jgi:hypothetical protein